MKRRRSESYLDFVRGLPCLICGAEGEAAHVRYGSYIHGKRPTGMAEKSHDRWAVPLCPKHHRLDNDSQHSTNELHWWQSHMIDPLMIAGLLSLHYAHDDRQAATAVCTHALLITQGA